MKEPIKLERTVKTQPAKKRRRWRRPGLLSSLLFILLCAAIVYFLLKLYTINILPLLFLAGAAAIIILLTLWFHHFWFNKSKRPITRMFCIFICLFMSAAYVLGGYYLDLANSVLEQVTNRANQNVMTISTVVLDSSGITSMNQLDTKRIGVLSDELFSGMAEYRQQIGKKTGASLVEYNDLLAMVNDLLDGKIEALALPETLRQEVHEVEEFYSFQFITTDIDQFKYSLPDDQSYINYPDKVADITQDPFTILISGNDSYGVLLPAARSDVNMLATVNPKTHTVLLTSLPRDSYIEITCKKDSTMCEPDSYDKLTHTGIFGIGVTESSLEDYLGIDINYTVRVNFSSLTNLVDALGGIDVFVEDGLAVEHFYTNGTQGVEEGWNHLDGEGALAFSRERYSYAAGDLQRVRNQQLVIQAMIKKMLSPAVIMKYPELMDALTIAFDTNISDTEVKELLKYVISSFMSWEFISNSVTGIVDEAYCYALEDYALVTFDNEESLEDAISLIHDVLNGKEVTTETIQEIQADNSTSTDTSTGGYVSGVSDPYDYWD